MIQPCLARIEHTQTIGLEHLGKRGGKYRLGFAMGGVLGKDLGLGGYWIQGHCRERFGVQSAGEK